MVPKVFPCGSYNSAGQLELKYGDRIREHAEAVTLEAAELRVWLRTVLKVDASEQTCRTWRVRSWSTAGRLMSIYDIEHSIGDRLRLPQYREHFEEEACVSLAADLSEGQPAVYLAEPFLLRQWYAKYHPDSGPLRISSAAELESLLGEDLRMWVCVVCSGIRALTKSTIGSTPRLIVSHVLCKLWQVGSCALWLSYAIVVT